MCIRDSSVTGSLSASNIDANAGLDISIASGTTSAMFGSNSQINGIQNMPSAAGTPFVVGQDTGSLRSAIFAGNVDVNAGLDVTGNITCTGLVDGRDVQSDGGKLDSIEQGATADQTKSDIDALNINADQVDSLHANQFLRSDTADTADADITFNGGAGAVTIAAQSDIRLDNGGTWTGDVACKLQHHANILYINYPDAGSARFRDSAGNDNLQLDSAGNLTATGNVTAYSDARLKTDVNTINDALGIVGKLRGVSYKWIATDKPSIGVIAQEIEEVIPEVVLTNRNTNPSTGETTEIKSVDYGKIVGVLINAINELKAEVDALKKPKKKGGK